MKKSIMYVVDAMDPEKIRSTLEADIEYVPAPLTAGGNVRKRFCLRSCIWLI